MNGSSMRVDGLVCNDFSPQARLAAALKKKLNSIGKTAPTDADKVARVDEKSGQRFNKYGDPIQDGPLTETQKAYRKDKLKAEYTRLFGEEKANKILASYKG